MLETSGVGYREQPTVAKAAAYLPFRSLRAYTRRESQQNFFEESRISERASDCGRTSVDHPTGTWPANIEFESVASTLSSAPLVGPINVGACIQNSS